MLCYSYVYQNDTCIIDIKSSFPAIKGVEKFFNSTMVFGCGQSKL